MSKQANTTTSAEPTDLIPFKEVVALLGQPTWYVRKLDRAGVLTRFQPVKHMHAKYYRSQILAMRTPGGNWGK